MAVPLPLMRASLFFLMITSFPSTLYRNYGTVECGKLIEYKLFTCLLLNKTLGEELGERGMAGENARTHPIPRILDNRFVGYVQHLWSPVLAFHICYDKSDYIN